MCATGPHCSRCRTAVSLAVPVAALSAVAAYVIETEWLWLLSGAAATVAISFAIVWALHRPSLLIHRHVRAGAVPVPRAAVRAEVVRGEPRAIEPARVISAQEWVRERAAR